MAPAYAQHPTPRGETQLLPMWQGKPVGLRAVFLEELPPLRVLQGQKEDCLQSRRAQRAQHSSAQCRVIPLG